MHISSPKYCNWCTHTHSKHCISCFTSAGRLCGLRLSIIRSRWVTLITVIELLLHELRDDNPVDSADIIIPTSNAVFLICACVRGWVSGWAEDDRKTQRTTQRRAKTKQWSGHSKGAWRPEDVMLMHRPLSSPWLESATLPVKLTCSFSVRVTVGELQIIICRLMPVVLSARWCLSVKFRDKIE